MIYNYPYFGFPNYMNHFSQSTNRISSPLSPKSNISPKPLYNANSINKYNTYSHSNSQNSHLHSNNANNNEIPPKERPIFSILGIQLYFDDILLICVILFLYNEKIEDTYLLLALVLLLLN